MALSSTGQSEYCFLVCFYFFFVHFGSDSSLLEQNVLSLIPRNLSLISMNGNNCLYWFCLFIFKLILCSRQSITSLDGSLRYFTVDVY